MGNNLNQINALTPTISFVNTTPGILLDGNFDRVVEQKNPRAEEKNQRAEERSERRVSHARIEAVSVRGDELKLERRKTQKLKKYLSAQEEQIWAQAGAIWVQAQRFEWKHEKSISAALQLKDRTLEKRYGKKHKCKKHNM